MTKQLVEYFQVVHAVDVSPDMIEYARAHVKSDNVTFHLTNGSVLPVPDSSVAAAFSCEVFQHFDRASIAEGYFTELSRVLRPGGSLMIHLPLYSWPHALRTVYSAVFSLWTAADAVQAKIRRLLLRKGFGNPFMFGIKYETETLYGFLYQLGFRDIEVYWFENTHDGGRPSFRTYLFARKPDHQFVAKRESSH
jgi:ubiquinone/menaquinone biosynthesis C-methylase UbiE